MQQNDQLRLARLEAVCNQLRAEMDDVMRKAYDSAVEEQDEEAAAELARKIRNRLLDQSDSQMTLDRVGLDMSSITSFISSLKNILDNSWAIYRQHLRDITAQEGFPFTIDWGTPPDHKTDDEDQQ